jgi:hypothetical protein
MQVLSITGSLTDFARRAIEAMSGLVAAGSNDADGILLLPDDTYSGTQQSKQSR